ncbi:hypothetical protein V8G54_032038, partial [Vigna mungo]
VKIKGLAPVTLGTQCWASERHKLSKSKHEMHLQNKFRFAPNAVTSTGQEQAVSSNVKHTHVQQDLGEPALPANSKELLDTKRGDALLKVSPSKILKEKVDRVEEQAVSSNVKHTHVQQDLGEPALPAVKHSKLKNSKELLDTKRGDALLKILKEKVDRVEEQAVSSIVKHTHVQQDLGEPALPAVKHSKLKNSKELLDTKRVDALLKVYPSKILKEKIDRVEDKCNLETIAKSGITIALTVMLYKTMDLRFLDFMLIQCTWLGCGIHPGAGLVVILLKDLQVTEW